MKPAIKIENSVPSQTRPAYAVRWAGRLLADHGAKKVAEYGCGRFRNFQVLNKHFEQIDLVETTKQFKRFLTIAPRGNHVRFLDEAQFVQLDETYDEIFMISILHTIPSKRKRSEILKVCRTKLKSEGHLVVDVPQSETYYNRRKGQAVEHNDGWLMRWGTTYTFYKSFYAAELDQFVIRRGFKKFHSVYRSKHIIRIYQKS